MSFVRFDDAKVRRFGDFSKRKEWKKRFQPFPSDIQRLSRLFSTSFPPVLVEK